MGDKSLSTTTGRKLKTSGSLEAGPKAKNAWDSPRRLRGLISPAVLSALVAVGFAMVLGARPLTSADLGYHLDYGQTFLRTGTPVDHNDYIFLSDGDVKPEDCGPGCWVDSQGRYRFPNANWLFQVLLAIVYSAGGWTGMWIMQMVLMAGLVGASVVGMRRLGLGPMATAAGVGLIAMVAYERFILRPEMFSMMLLAVQLAILLPTYRVGWVGGDAADWPGAQKVQDGPSRRTIVALVLVQLLMVNLHSYFLLGLFPAGAMFVDALARLLWQRLSKRKADASLARKTRRLGLLVALQVAVCFVNPWTWRMVLLPFQTVLFLSAHDVGQQMTYIGHPWQMIGEFWRPFAVSFELNKATYAYQALLAIAALGGVLALIRRRWAYAILLAAFAAVSLSMRRNIAPAVVIMAPVAMAAIADFFRGRKPGRLSSRRLRLAVAGVLIAASGAGIYSVVTQRFYYSEKTNARFGWGVSRIDLPVGPADFVRKNLPDAGRVWTDFYSSSNMHFLTGCDVPVLSNTWAYPPRVLARHQALAFAPEGIFDEFQRRGVRVAAVRVNDGIAMRFSQDCVARQLAGKWKMVYFDGVYAVFVQRDRQFDSLPEVACSHENLLQRAAELDPVKAVGLELVGESAYMMDDLDAARKAYDAAIRCDDQNWRTWNMLGLCLAQGAEKNIAGPDPDYWFVRRDLWAAEQCFETALRICDDKSFMEAIRQNISNAKSRMTELGISE